MNPTDLQTFNQAVAAAQSGQTQAAHATLTGLNQRYPTDTNVLLWLAFTTSDWHTASVYVEQVARLSPNDPSLSGARTSLASQKPVAPPLPQPVVYPNLETAGVATASTAVYPTESITKSKRPRRLIIIGVLAIIAIAITTDIILISDSKNPNGIGDIPTPPTGRLASLDTLIRSSIENNHLQNFEAVMDKAQVNYYVLSNSKISDIASFYNKQMPNKGWTTLINGTQQNGRFIQAYSKGEMTAAILIEGPETNTYPANVPNPIFKPGDLIVTTMEVDKKDLAKIEP